LKVRALLVGGPRFVGAALHFCISAAFPGDPQRRRCEQCGEQVSFMMWDYRRADARYCSARCRQRAYLARGHAASG